LKTTKEILKRSVRSVERIVQMKTALQSVRKNVLKKIARKSALRTQNVAKESLVKKNLVINQSVLKEKLLARRNVLVALKNQAVNKTIVK
jgi:hypothetical protein